MAKTFTTVYPLKGTLTANGVLELGGRESTYNVKVSGTFGAGTVTVGYVDAAGTFVAYQDATPANITLAADGSVTIAAGMGKAIALSLAGATDPVLYCEVNPIKAEVTAANV